MNEPSRKAVGALAALALLLQTGCGTILYPERRGQKGANIDAGVAVLDGIGLLFFILPGVIAFAVDFGDGAIYLPSGQGKSRVFGRVEKIRFDARRDGSKDIERLVREKTGLAIRLDDPGMRRVRLDSPSELPGRFADAVTLAAR